MMDKTDQTKDLIDFVAFNYAPEDMSPAQMFIMRSLFTRLASRIFLNKAFANTNLHQIIWPEGALEWEYFYDDDQRIKKVKLKVVMNLTYKDDES